MSANGKLCQLIPNPAALDVCQKKQGMHCCQEIHGLQLITEVITWLFQKKRKHTDF